MMKGGGGEVAAPFLLAAIVRSDVRKLPNGVRNFADWCFWHLTTLYTWCII